MSRVRGRRVMVKGKRTRRVRWKVSEGYSRGMEGWGGSMSMRWVRRIGASSSACVVVEGEGEWGEDDIDQVGEIGVYGARRGVVVL
jgi:hypothetical protein